MKRPMLALDSVIVLEITADSLLRASLGKAGTPAKPQPDCAPNLESPTAERDEADRPAIVTDALLSVSLPIRVTRVLAPRLRPRRLIDNVTTIEATLPLRTSSEVSNLPLSMRT